MDESDKERLYRNIKLSIKDLETVAQLLSQEKWLKFKIGDKERVEYLEKLLNKVKNSIVKDGGAGH